ncbi:MAG: flippase [Acidimicrobiales bacterium]
MDADDLTPAPDGQGRPKDRPADDNDGIFGNTTALVVGRLGIAAFGWAGTVFIVRGLSVDAFGRFTFIFGFLGLLSIITEMGIGRVAIAGVADETRDQARFAGAYVVLRCLLGIVGYAFAMAFVVVAGYGAIVVEATALAGVVVLIATPSNALEIGYQVRMRMRPVATAGVVAQIAQFALTAAIAASGRGSLLIFMVPAILYAAVDLFLKWRWGRHLIPIQLCVDLAAWKAMITEAVPLAIGGALATLYYRIDTVMLSKMDTFASVAVYGVAYKFIDIAHYVPSSLHRAVMFPMVKHWDGDRSRFRQTLRQSFALLMLTGSLLLAEFMVFSTDALGLLYGRHYEAGGDAARLVMGGEFFVFFTILAWTALIAMGRNRIYAFAAGTGVVVNVGLNLWMIPAFSYQGAAIATLITNAAVSAIMWTTLVRSSGLGAVGFVRPLLAIPAGGLAMAAGFGLKVVTPWPVAAALTAVIFIGAAEALRVAGPGGLRSLMTTS